MGIRRIVLVGLLVSACAVGRVTVTGPPFPGTTPSTAAPTASTAPVIDLTVTGCASPPVTFGLLCEVVDRVTLNHFDPPEEATLIAGALSGLDGFPTESIGDVPRGLTCAIPSAAWEPVCAKVIDRLRTDPVPVADLVEAGVVGMLTEGLDPYTQYIAPELVSAVGEDGIIPGVGIVVSALTVAGSPCVRIELVCPLKVVTVIPGSPAETGGLIAGDQIEAVDGEPVQGKTVVEVAALLAGDAGTSTELSVTRIGEPELLTLVRADSTAPPIMLEIVGRVGYVRLPEFGADTHLYMHAALEVMFEASPSTLILDLRDNPGGFLYSASIIGSEFFSSGLLYKTLSPAGNLDYPAIEGGIATRIPMMVLVNGSSASAAEILAAVLQERGRAVIVGQPTYGKNLVQQPYELHNGGILRVSVATWTTPAGASVAGTGVVPDVTADLPSQYTVEQVVEAALAAAG